MGQGMSCVTTPVQRLSPYVQAGDLDVVMSMVQKDPAFASPITSHRHSPLHVAAANGRVEIMSYLLERFPHPDAINRHKQTPLMLAAMHGRIECVKKLIAEGANILMFDSPNGRTCLHHAAYFGHSDCVQAILSAAQSNHVAASWGYARFVNIRDSKGATPLHLAARQRRSECLHILLHNGALPSASTGGFGCRGSTPLHLAAKGGSLDCIRELLAWGADRLHRDASGRIPHTVALKHKHPACAALLNPAASEPLIWPASLKVIMDLNPDAKSLLERALMKANVEREKNILESLGLSYPAKPEDDVISEVNESDLCCICFAEVCTIEARECGHKMCAQCALALCCHTKPKSASALASPLLCPFCRTTISLLVVSEVKICEECDGNHVKLVGNSSFSGMSGPFGIMGGIGSGRIDVENENEWVDKP